MGITLKINSLACLVVVFSIIISSLISLKALLLFVLIILGFFLLKMVAEHKLVFVNGMLLPIVFVPLAITGGIYFSFTYFLLILTFVVYWKYRSKVTRLAKSQKIMILFGIIIAIRIVVIDVITMQQSILSTINLLTGDLAKIVCGVIIIQLSGIKELREDFFKGLLFSLLLMLGMHIYEVSIGLQNLLLQGYSTPLFNYNTSDGKMRPFGTFLTPVTYGAYLAVLCGFLFWYIPLKFRVFKWIVLVAGIFAMVSTQTRSAWIAFAIGMIIVAMIQPRIKWDRILFIGFPIILLLICLVIIKPSLMDMFTGRLATLTDTQFDSNAIRMELWKATIMAMNDGNWLIGYGGTNFTDIISKYTSYQIASLAHPHQTFLEILFRYGLIGLFPYLILIGSSISSAIKQIRNAEDLATSNAVLASLIIFTIASLFETLWGSFNFFITIFLIIGFLNKKEFSDVKIKPRSNILVNKNALKSPIH